MENTTLVAFGTVYPIFFLISNSHHNFVGNKSLSQYVDLRGNPEELEMHDKERNPKQTEETLKAQNY